MKPSAQAYLVNGVHIRISPLQHSNDYLALAKRQPFLLPGVQPMHEPGEVWFKYGPHPADLIDQLVAEVNESD